ncbi:MAG: UDP-glucose 4-epimerase GalE [Hyphomicrobiaceae bacterium]|nr:UDP-glucose 4-epimerase GalE [Hyphomicrobiaceae bacterium]
MAILVTGGAGYIGSHVVLELIDAGETVVVLDDLSTGRRSAVPPQARLVVGDIGDAALVASIVRHHGVTAVLHFAGSVIVPESVANPLKYYHNNTGKSRTLVASVVEAGVEAFIFSSTAAVYGMPRHIPVTEDAALAPISPYGTSKLMTEWMLRDTAAATSLRYVALRYFNVAGADPKGRSGQSTPEATHLIKVAAETALGKRPSLSVFGTDYDTPDGTCIRDYIHVTDLARAHLAALDHLRRGGRSEIFNCGYGRGFSVLEVIGAVRRCSGREFEVRHTSRRAGDPAALVANSDRLRRQLGWQPELDDLDTIVGHALRWEEGLAGGRR